MKKTQNYANKSAVALDLWVKLARASATFGKVSAENIKTFGLTVPQFGALECLGHLGPLTLTSLSRKMLVSNGNITCVVDHLERLGIVERTPSSNDRRATFVKLTARGEELFREIFAKHAEFVGNAASVLTKEEQEVLGRLLKKLGLMLQKQFNVNNGNISHFAESLP